MAGLVAFIDRADRAVRRALSALDTRRLVERDVGGGCHAGLFAAPDELQRPDILHLLADDGATAALHAFFRVQHDGTRGVVDRDALHIGREGIFADAEIRSEFLQFAVATTRALQAVVRVVGEDELEHGAAHVDDVGVVRCDFHAGGDLSATCAEQLRRACVAYHANPAGGACLQIRVVAERGDFDMHRLGGIQDRRAGRDGDRNPVDFELNQIRHSKKPFQNYSRVIAWNLQIS